MPPCARVSRRRWLVVVTVHVIRPGPFCRHHSTGSAARRHCRATTYCYAWRRLGHVIQYHFETRSPLACRAAARPMYCSINGSRRQSAWLAMPTMPTPPLSSPHWPSLTRQPGRFRATIVIELCGSQIIPTGYRHSAPTPGLRHSHAGLLSRSLFPRSSFMPKFIRPPGFAITRCFARAAHTLSSPGNITPVKYSPRRLRLINIVVSAAYRH